MKDRRETNPQVQVRDSLADKEENPFERSTMFGNFRRVECESRNSHEGMKAAGNGLNYPRKKDRCADRDGMLA
jgi:hypothetical protein